MLLEIGGCGEAWPPTLVGKTFAEMPLVHLLLCFMPMYLSVFTEEGQHNDDDVKMYPFSHIIASESESPSDTLLRDLSDSHDLGVNTKSKRNRTTFSTRQLQVSLSPF